MGYGVRIKNSSGNLIIDGTYKNFAEYASGTVAMGVYNTVATIAFAATTQIPLIALRNISTVCYVIPYGIRKTGSDYDGFYLLRGYGGGTGAFNVDWKVYLAHPAASGETYGIKIYDPTGVLLFESGRNYFNLYQVDTGISLVVPPTLMAQQGEDYDATRYSDIAHAGIENPYYALSPNSLWMTHCVAGTTFHNNTFRPGMRKIDATNVRVGWGSSLFLGGSLPPGQPSGEGGWNPDLNLMVLK